MADVGVVGCMLALRYPPTARGPSLATEGSGSKCRNGLVLLKEYGSVPIPAVEVLFSCSCEGFPCACMRSLRLLGGGWLDVMALNS